MMPTVMRQWGSTLGTLPGDGQYLKAMDFEAHGGTGEITLTSNLQEAMKFAGLVEAHAFYKTSPQCRTDGKPNRPLTAANWEFVHIPD